VAVVLAGLDASLHLTPDRQPCQPLAKSFLTGWMILLPNQQRQNTEGNSTKVMAVEPAKSH